MKASKKLFAFLLIFALILSCTHINAFAQGDNDLAATSDLSSEELELIYDESNYEYDFAPGEVIIGLNQFSDATADTLDSELSTDIEFEVAEDLFDNVEAEREVYLVTLEEETEQAVLDVIEALKDDPNVAFIEPNYTYTLGNQLAVEQSYAATSEATSAASATTSVTPNDPHYSNLYGMNLIGAPEAWAIETGSAAVKVGVLDTGVAYTHSDLAANVDTSLAFDAVYGLDAMDYHSHGTHVAGTIGAVGNNGIGVAGVCWDVSIVPIKILDNGGYGEDSTLIAGINHATANNIPIINLSLQNYSYSAAVKLAFDTYPGLAVIAAGNHYGRDIDSNPCYPGSYNCDNILTVASTTSTDSLSDFSNYGVNTVELGAPGTDVYSTIPNNSYGNKSGTSMAAPHVAGAAALLLSYDSTLTTAELKDALMSTVDQVSALNGKCVTGGRLNVYKALKYVAVDIVVYNYSQLKSALANSNYSVIGIANDIQLTETLTINRSVTLKPYKQKSITLRAVTLSGTNVVELMTINGNDIKINLTGIILDARGERSGVYIYGTVTTIGGEIRGSKSSGLWNYGTLTLIDGIISGNKSSSYGGGIRNSGTLMIIGGEISGNTADILGGGIFNTEMLTLSGVNISGNSTKRSYESGGGGGISNYLGTLNITSGTISDNTAYSGGGIDNDRGTVTISGGVISNNASTTGGGVSNTGTMTLSGGAISNNNALGYAGGVYNNASSATLNITGGEINGNTANTAGGVYNSGTMTLSGGAISGNSARKDGGGIYDFGSSLNPTTVNITGGEISDNTATKDGGGIYIYSNRSTVTLSNVTISGNSATERGGGIFNWCGTLTLSSGVISDNTSTTGGGAFIAGDMTTISGGVIRNNTATSYGGGVYIYSNSTLTQTGGTIFNNTPDNIYRS